MCCIFKILHSELEASLQTSRDQLAVTSSELEKQQALTEKLETDLLSLNKSNGEATPSNSTDVLAGLELGKNPVRLYSVHSVSILMSDIAFTGVVIEKYPSTFYILGRHVNPAHCDQPTRSVPAT
jgi:hypothetical protein